MKFNAILFDMDGTLVNSLEDIAESMNFVLKEKNYPIHNITDYKLLIGNGIENLVTLALPENKRSPEIIGERLTRMKEVYSERWLNHTCLYEGIDILLDRLVENKVILSVLSNKSDKLTKVIGEKLLRKWRFNAIIGLREGMPAKPDPASALEISQKAGVPPGKFIYLGDTATDMLTAINSGMCPVGVSWGFRPVSELLEAGAYRIIDEPIELMDFFNKITL
jgi:phosphoglycolate phosphatase